MWRALTTYFMMTQLEYIINIYYSYIFMCCDAISYTGCIYSASQWHIINFKLKGKCGGITLIYAEKKLHDEFTAEWEVLRKVLLLFTHCSKHFRQSEREIQSPRSMDHVEYSRLFPFAPWDFCLEHFFAKAMSYSSFVRILGLLLSSFYNVTACIVLLGDYNPPNELVPRRACLKCSSVVDC